MAGIYYLLYLQGQLTFEHCYLQALFLMRIKIMKIASLILLFTMFAFQASAWNGGTTSDQQTGWYYQISSGNIVDNTPEFGLHAGSVKRQQVPERTSSFKERSAILDIQFNHLGTRAIKMQDYNYLPQIIAALDDNDGQIDSPEENNNGQENTHEENISEQQENNNEDAQAIAQEGNNDDVEEVFADFSLPTAVGIFLGVIMATITIIVN